MTGLHVGRVANPRPIVNRPGRVTKLPSGVVSTLSLSMRAFTTLGHRLPALKRPIGNRPQFGNLPHIRCEEVEE